MSKPKIAIIGAGISGLTLAHYLQDFADVTLFEKNKQVGGRMVTRFDSTYQFDYGAQFFYAKTPIFQEFLEPFIQNNTVTIWQARFAEIDQDHIINQRTWDQTFQHYVCSPNMNQLCESLAKNLEVHFNAEICFIRSFHTRWELADLDGMQHGPFDWVICCMPPALCMNLLPETFSYYAQVKSYQMQGCYTLMLGFQDKIDLPFDAALVKNANLSWISANHTKPQKHKNFSIIAHATNNWADQNMTMDLNIIKQNMQNFLQDTLHINTELADEIHCHRWHYANIQTQHGPKSFYDYKTQLAVCGDWCIKGNVEAAFLSAHHLAMTLINQFKN